MPVPLSRLALGAAAPHWRRSGRHLVRWLIAGGLALVAAAVVAHRASEADAVLAAYGQRRPVAVARHDLTTGHVVAPSDLDERELPVGAVPGSAVASADAVGRTVTAPVPAGEAVVATRLAPEGASGLAALVPAGRRAVAIPIEGSGLELSVGDLVDVVDPGDATTGSVASDAAVVAIDEDSVTVAVDVTDVPRVAEVLGRTTPVLALRGAG